MFSILLSIQILVSVSIIALVLLQQGKGADMGAAFGSGSSGTVFGARGSGSFFTRATGFLAAVFFINCLLIASPLVRETGETEETLADRIEQQETLQQEAAERAAIGEVLENQQAGEEDFPAAITGQLPGEESDVPAVISEQLPAEETDVPGVPAEAPDSPVADDLPQ
jgi:preprotein translocase subunit SecG